ncbi:MAG: hypothetical protein WBO00_09940 [Steroidobacteraceae bacterium]
MKSGTVTAIARRLMCLLALVAWAAFAQHADSQIALVCEHGSVKSLIAASLFDRAAGQRGLPFRAVSRGVNPEQHVPPASVDCAAARAAFQRHIDTLLDELQEGQQNP